MRSRDAQKQLARTSLIAPGWKCLLVGKCIEPCSQIITQNVHHIIKQCVWSDMLPVCEHLQVGLCKSPFIQVANLVVTNSQILRFLCSLLRSCVYCDFLAMWRQKKELCRETTPSLPLLLFPSQGAMKITFTACLSGKLKQAFTNPVIISRRPKSFLTSRIDFTVLLSFKFLKKQHLPIRQVKNRIQ